jgi:hypothetical protein
LLLFSFALAERGVLKGDAFVVASLVLLTALVSIFVQPIACPSTIRKITPSALNSSSNRLRALPGNKAQARSCC